jgi:phenylacetate-coenzyme A ligase PaaK-like adenylate-forming protein
METLLEMHRRGDMEGIWKRYCGFLELTPEEFADSQNRLLEEQLLVWKKSALVSRIFGGTIPSSVEEFRERAPITTYEEYAGSLIAKNQSELPSETYEWVHTSGKSGEYEFKWVPYTRAMYDNISDCTLASFILGPCRRRGHIAMKEGDRLMFSLAPTPYVSGLCMRAMHEQFNFRIWPDYEKALKMDFFERTREGVRLAFSEGIDYFYGITSIMLSISEQLEQMGSSGGNAQANGMKLQPKVLLRLLKGILKSKLRGGPLRPRDLWNVKGIMCSGMDTAIYRERIRALWGEYPWEVYGCTELAFLGFQHYAGPGLVIRDRSTYCEFMELDDYARWKDDRSFRPRLRLQNEVEAGKEYALVGTSFHGGVFVRYVPGDALKVASLSDDRIGCKLPQFTFSSRIDDVIDIAGFTRLSEKAIWSAVENSGVDYVDWVVAKEYRNEKPVLHLYLEARTDGHDPLRIQETVHDNLKKIDLPYRDLEEMAGIRPLAVTLLSKGTFARYLKERQAAGFDLAHSKPPHMNPAPEIVSRLQAMSALKI